MSRGSIARRSWASFAGGSRTIPPRPAERGRAGYALWRRTWASFTGLGLPPRPVHVPVSASSQAPAQQPQAGPAAPGWFTLPPLPVAGALAASGTDAVVLEAASPGDRATFLLRHPAGNPSEYGLELVVRDAGDRPLLVTVTYGLPDGDRRTLLLPVVPGQFGPAASYVRLRGFGPGVTWAATGPAPVPAQADWDPAVVVDSVGAALNETTRHAWRRVRALVGEGVRDAIDGALR